MQKLMMIIFLAFFILSLSVRSSEDINDNMVILDYPIMMADSIITNSNHIYQILNDTNNVGNGYNNILMSSDYQFELENFLKDNNLKIKSKRSIRLNSLVKNDKIHYYRIVFTYSKENVSDFLIVFRKDIDEHNSNWKISLIQIGYPNLHVPPIEFEKKE